MVGARKQESIVGGKVARLIDILSRERFDGDFIDPPTQRHDFRTFESRSRVATAAPRLPGTAR
jgi:hypothetical protein